MLETVMDVPAPGVLEFLFAEGEGALLEAPVDGADAGGADNNVDSGDGAGGGDGADAGAGDGDAGGTDVDDGAGADGGEGGELSGAKLWNASKEQLAALDPKLRSAINKELHKADRISKMFPDGMEKVQTTLKAIEQLVETPGVPAEKAIADTLAERAYFRELDDAYTQGKPEFVTKLAEASPESFDKLAPQIFNQYAQTNPDGFASFVSQTVLQHMDGAEVPLHFKVLATFLPQLADGPAKDRVIEAIEGIYAWQNSLRALAAKKPELKAGTDKKQGDDDIATREQQLAEKQLDVTRQTWNAEMIDSGVRTVYGEADKYAGTKKLKLDATEKKKVLSKVGEELDIRLAGNKDYGKAMQQYLKDGNKQAYIQRLNAERKKLIPGATRRAVDDVVADRPAKQPAKKDATQKPAPGTPDAAAAASGEKVEWIGGSPTTQGLVVDLNKTSHAMLMKKRAYIKGRDTPVAWK